MFDSGMRTIFELARDGQVTSSIHLICTAILIIAVRTLYKASRSKQPLSPPDKQEITAVTDQKSSEKALVVALANKYLLLKNNAKTVQDIALANELYQEFVYASASYSPSNSPKDVMLGIKDLLT